MFIRKSHHSYYVGTAQHSGRGEYLALFSWNTYKAKREESEEEYFPDFQSPDPRYPNGKPKLWACVRTTALSQLGHWMMGNIHIGGKSITVSGPIGHDGLPLDFQEVPKKFRSSLVEVPEDVATIFWEDNGHNDIGSAREALMAWALVTFPPTRKDARW